MAAFPSSPVPPAEFFEAYLPEAFASADLPEEMRSLEARLGVKLLGEGGGEWLFEVERGALRVAPGSRDGAAFTVVQSVEDWRGALWEGRGGAFGRQAAALFRPGAQPAAAVPGGLAAPRPALLAQLQGLDGMIRMVVTGGEGGDWQVDLKLGPGALPAEPTTTLTVSAEDVDQMESGALDPIEAFMAGRIRLEGDMTLMMQMQALQMQAAMSAGGVGPAGDGSGGTPGA